MDIIIWIVFIIGMAISSCHAKEDLKHWYKEMDDLKLECQDFAASEVTSQELFTVVDCDAKNAVYRYNYQSMDKAKPKKGAFNGAGIISFPKSEGSNGKFKHGMRFGKCLSLAPFLQESRILRISGNFAEDKLEGRVILEFLDDVISVGHAVGNRLVGIIRNFKADRQNVSLRNVTDAEGNWFLKKDGFDFIHLRPRGSNRIFLTNEDFSEIFVCDPKKSSSLYFRECYVIEKGLRDELELDMCSPILNFRKSELSQIGQTFSFNVRTGERLTEEKEGETFQLNCLKTEPNLRAAMLNWFASLAKESKDQFWYIWSDHDPLDIEEPVVDIELDYYKDQALFEGTKVRVSDGVTELAWGRIEKGRLRINLTSTDLKRVDDWKSVLHFELPSPSGGHKRLQESMEIDFGFKARLNRGRLHGPVAIYGIVPLQSKERCRDLHSKGSLAYFGWFDSGKLVGNFWRGLVGGSWLHGKVNEQGRVSGDDITYIYPDFKTAFRGKFENGIMKHGQESEVIGLDCDERGVRVLELTEPSGPSYHYEPPTLDSFGDQPLLMDPIDRRYVDVRTSDEFDNAGEGAYAKEDVPDDTVFVLYSGRILNADQMDDLVRRQSRELEGTSPDDPRVTENWMYRHSIKNCGLRIDIPPEFGSMENYRGTLGHKVNHKFIPNSVYIVFESARFGVILAVKTKQEIKRGEEFFAHYGYGPKTNLPWYRELFKKFAKEHPELVSKEALEDLEKDPVDTANLDMDL